MSRLLGAAACALLALSSAAAAPKTLAGKVAKSSSRIAPGADGRAAFRDGRVTITDKAGNAEELKADPRTKVTLDGKPAQFKAAVPGTIVLRARFDPATKVLASLDLKSGPRDEAPGRETGELAGTDVLKGTLSVRIGPNSTRDYTVTETTTFEGRDGKPLPFEALKPGDAVEVNSRDGKSAAEVRVVLPP